MRTIVKAQTLMYPYTTANISSARFAECCIHPFVVVANPATAPFMNSFEATMYAEKKYSTDLNVLSLSAGASFNGNGIAILLQHFGNMVYSEKIAGLSMGKRLGRVNAGFSVQHINVNIPGIAKAGYWHTILAATFGVADNVTTSVRLINPDIYFSLKSREMRPAAGYSLGFGWEISPVVYTGMEYTKQEAEPMSVTFHLQYQFATNLFAALTWSTFSNQPYLCAGWSVGSMQVSAGCSYHSSLGMSPAVMLLYQRKKEAQR